ncbi:unnamed protein product [Alternaria alternata]
MDSSAIAQSQRNESSHPPNRADIDQALVAGVEEPQDDDAATNGMAMVFADEHTSAFFGESSNINFTRLLLRAVATARQADIQVPGTKDHASFLYDSNVPSINHGRSQSKTPSMISAKISSTSLPEVAVMNRLIDTYFDTAGIVFPFLHEEATRKTYSECLENGFKRARRTWLGTLNMMFALTTMLDRENFPSAKKRFERGDLYYHRAVELCGELSKHVAHNVLREFATQLNSPVIVEVPSFEALLGRWEVFSIKHSGQREHHVQGPKPSPSSPLEAVLQAFGVSFPGGLLVEKWEYYPCSVKVRIY